MSRSWRESDAKKDGRRLCCIEHDFAYGVKMRTSTGTRDNVVKIKSDQAQFIAAEKDGEGMALKIRIRAEDMPDV